MAMIGNFVRPNPNVLTDNEHLPLLLRLESPSRAASEATIYVIYPVR